MAGPNHPYTLVDNAQITRYTFDESKDAIRVDVVDRTIELILIKEIRNLNVSKPLHKLNKLLLILIGLQVLNIILRFIK